MNTLHCRIANRRATAWLLLCLVLLLASPLAAQQQKNDGGTEGAKLLFYNPATGAASRPEARSKSKLKSQPSRLPVSGKSGHPGIHYWMEMEGAGKVTDDYVFHTGDRIKLHVRSNVDGYLTLWAYDPSGESQLIFPAPDQSRNNQVKAYSEYALPGVIEFKPPAEDERLLIFFSQSPDDAPQPEAKRLTAQYLRQAAESDGGKALVFEVEKKDREKAGTYIVNRQGGAIAKEIRLKHRPRKE